MPNTQFSMLHVAPPSKERRQAHEQRRGKFKGEGYGYFLSRADLVAVRLIGVCL